LRSSDRDYAPRRYNQVSRDTRHRLPLKTPDDDELALWSEKVAIVLRCEMDVDGLAGGARCVGRRAVDRERAGGGIPDAEIDGFLCVDLRTLAGV
jgi:hypothetical protein